MPEFERHGDVVDRREVVEEVEILENPANQVPSNVDHAGRALQSVRPLGQRDGAAVAGEQTTDDVEQGGFSRARGTHQRDHFALFDVHVHALQNLKFVGTGAERFGEALN